MTQVTQADPAPPEPSHARLTWWDLYDALARHGHTHPGLQPVEVHHPSSELLYSYPDVLAALEVTQRLDRRDASAFADWVDSFDFVHAVETRPALGHPADTRVTAVGQLGPVTVMAWSIIRGTTTVTTPTEGATTVTAAALRAYDDVRHPVLDPTAFLPISGRDPAGTGLVDPDPVDETGQPTPTEQN